MVTERSRSKTQRAQSFLYWLSTLCDLCV